MAFSIKFNALNSLMSLIPSIFFALLLVFSFVLDIFCCSIYLVFSIIHDTLRHWVDEILSTSQSTADRGHIVPKLFILKNGHCKIIWNDDDNDYDFYDYGYNLFISIDVSIHWQWYSDFTVWQKNIQDQVNSANLLLMLSSLESFFRRR